MINGSCRRMPGYRPPAVAWFDVAPVVVACSCARAMCSGRGDVWSTVLAGLGLVADVHRGPLVGGAWSEAVCFAGRGPGEVSVDGRKVVGISQRRTREGAWFQCAALLEWRPRELVDLLGLEPVEQVTAELEERAVGLVDLLAQDAPDPEELTAAFVAALPAGD